MAIDETLTKDEMSRLRIVVASKVLDVNGCQLWQGNISASGYPRLRFGANPGRLFFVHRLVKLLECAGSIEGLHVHHKCKEKRCVNPRHLAVLHAGPHAKEHVKHVCKRGHSLNDDPYFRPEGSRQCRKCIELRTSWQVAKARSIAAARPPVPPRPCSVCGKMFTPSYGKRDRATACGQKCRMTRFLAKRELLAKAERMI